MEQEVIIALGSAEYTKLIYPAGEFQVRLSETAISRVAEALYLAVVARIGNMEQVIELGLLLDAIRNATCSKSRIRVVMPYLPFARADRSFVPGDCFGLRVFSEIAKTWRTEIVTLDVHSSVATELIPGLLNVSAEPLIEAAILDWARASNSKTITVLCPDEGARKRYQLPLCIKGVAISVLHCSKKRDLSSGKFLGFTVPAKNEFPSTAGRTDPIIIVDDICDGGGTFIGIAEALKDYDLVLALYVTHGIFSKGLADLNERFTRIYTTNSFTDSLKNRSNADRVHVIDSIPLLMELKQVQSAMS